MWSLVLLVIPPGRGDVYNYVEQGWLVLQGLDPTVVPSGSVAGPYAGWGGAWTGTTVAYPPVGLALQAAVVWASAGSAWLALVLMRLLCVVAVVGLWLALPRLADLFGVSGRQAGWAVGLNPMIWVHGVAGIHLDMVAVTLAAAALCLLVPVAIRLGGATRHGSVAGLVRQAVLGTLLALMAVGIKPQAALALCFVVPFALTRGRSWRLRQLAQAVASALVVAVLVGAVAALSRVSPFGARWTSATGDPSWASSSWWSIWADVAGRAGGAPAMLHEALAPQALLWCSLAAVMVLLVVVLSVRLPEAAMFGALTLLVVCTIGPAGRPWYLLPAVLGLGLLRWAPTRQAIVTVLVLVAFSGEMFGTMSYLGRQAWSWGLAASLAVTIASVCATRRDVDADLQAIDAATGAWQDRDDDGAAYVERLRSGRLDEASAPSSRSGAGMRPSHRKRK
ncbi:polyprenol phosphomannose-dependent alpha 1,6 mannosyltransferase MptB [Propionibacteriaceae bacterium G1746]